MEYNVKKSIKKILLSLAIVIILLCGNGSCYERKERQVNFPAGDITLFIPSSANEGNDLIARALIPGMENVLDVNIAIENKPALKGKVAAMEVANAQPDGQKLYFNSQTLILMALGGIPEIKLENYQPVAQVVRDTAAVIVRSDAAYETLDDFIKVSKQKRIKAGHNGVGALWHLASVMYSKATDTEFQYVIYPNGEKQILKALEAGEIDVGIISPSEAKSSIDAGKLRVLAVLDHKRHPLIPDVPTCKELGVDIVFPVWRGFFTTAGVVEETLDILEKAVKASMDTNEFKNFINKYGFISEFRGHKEFSEFVYDQRAMYANLISELKK